MKLCTTLLFVIVNLIMSRTFGQSCSNGDFFIESYLTPTNPTYCLTQQVKLTVGGVCSSSAVNWYIATQESGPYTVLGTSNFNEYMCAAFFTFTPSTAGTYWVKAARDDVPCSWEPKQLTVVNAVPPSAPVITAATVCPNVVLTISAPDPQHSIGWYQDWFGSYQTVSGQTGSSLTRNPTNQDGAYTAAYTNSFGCRGAYASQLSVTKNGISPFHSTQNSGDVYFDYSTGNGIVNYNDPCNKLMIGFAGSGSGYFPTLRMKASLSFHTTSKAFAGRPLVGKHFDINPAPNGTYPVTPSSYELKLYYTQAEFNAFNARVSAGSSKLPKEPNGSQGYFDTQGNFVVSPGLIYYGDVTQCNLRVIKANGVPVTPGEGPDDYPGGAAEIAGTTGSYANIRTFWNSQRALWEVNITQQTSFSGFFITTQGATPLPVSLINFKVQEQENAVKLVWQTTAETNSEKFDVQHSTDARNWNPIGQVASSGESSITREYEYLHHSPVPGNNYYRLKMVDRDDSFEYSPIVSKSMSTGLANETVLFPNPAKDRVYLSGDQSFDSYEIRNMSGLVVKRGTLEKGAIQTLPVLNLGAGVYVVRLRSATGKQISQKLLLK